MPAKMNESLVLIQADVAAGCSHFYRKSSAINCALHFFFSQKSLEVCKVGIYHIAPYVYIETFIFWYTGCDIATAAG